jgi:outer membrane protein assembly factor BamB
LTARVVAAEFAAMILGLTPMRFVLLCLFFCGLTIRAADWPQWRGPLQTGHVPPGQPVPDTLPADPHKLWRIKVGEGFASPVVAGGRVFYADNQEMKETLHAVDAVTGRKLWSEVIDDSFKDNQGPPGPRCTPVVDGDRIFVQSCRGELQCRRAATGKLIWRKSYTNDFGAVFIGETGTAQGAHRHGHTAAPVVDGDRLIVLPGGTNGASVACLDKRTGKLIWKSQNDEAGYAPAFITTLGGIRQAVVFSCEGLLGLDLKDGRLLWRFPIKTKFSRHVTVPVTIDDMVMVSSHEHGVFGIRVTKKGTAFDAAQAWVTKEAAMNFSSPVAVGRHLYGLGPARNIICVDSRTGKVAWSKDGLINTAPGKAHSSFLVFGSSILVSTDEGQLILLAADPSAPREIARTQVSGVTWSTPAYADGRLYVRDGVRTGGELACVPLLP